MVNTKGTMTNRQWRTIQMLLKLMLNIFFLSNENLEGSWRRETGKRQDSKINGN